MRNVLSIDVEEHFQVHAMETAINRSDWDKLPSRVVASTQRILQLLAKHQTHATFFILGWVAERHPQLVREIAAHGHEIATHGYWHELIYRQTPAEFAADIEQSLTVIGRAYTGVIAGYRAPAFSITQASLWALDVLHDLGMQYDSSIFPLSLHDRYGLKDGKRFAHQLANGMWEFPASTVRIANKNLPVAGGGYFRLYPLPVTRAAIRHLNQEQQPAVIYLHPWEFDPQQPRVSNAPMLSRFRHYVNLNKTESRLDSLLQEFKFGSLQEVFAEQLRAGELAMAPL